MAVTMTIIQFGDTTFWWIPLGLILIAALLYWMSLNKINLAKGAKVIAIAILGIPIGTVFEKIIPNSAAKPLLDLVGNPTMFPCIIIFILAVLLFGVSIGINKSEGIEN